MALRRLLIQVKRHETQLREFSYLAAQPYRTSQHARGGVQKLSSSITSTLGRSNYSNGPASRLRVTEDFGALVVDREIGKATGLGVQEEVQPIMESNTKFSDVKGLDEAKAELENIVHYLRDPKSSHSKVVLLVGRHGNGKTMLARAIAGEAGVPFFPCSGREFEEISAGVGAQRVRDLFAAAKKRSPCVIFIDEIDVIGGSRNPKDQEDMKLTLNQLLVELDGIKRNDGIIVIATTYSAESLDEALFPAELLDLCIHVPYPDVEGRRHILEAHMSKVLKAEDVDLMTIARGTLAFSGADLANLINIAAHKAEMDGSLAVCMAYLENAKDKIMMECQLKSAVSCPKLRKTMAYHEGGHALVSIHSDGAFSLHKVTIVPDFNWLGQFAQLQMTRPRFLSISGMKILANPDGYVRRIILAQLDMLMGGRVAEELIIGESIPGGDSNDIELATGIARAMLTEDAPQNYDDMSTESRLLIDEKVRELLKRANENAKTILTTHKKGLHALANALLEHETVSGSQVKAILAQANSDQPLLTRLFRLARLRLNEL